MEIRTFVHDPEEEMGHDDNMIRDVGDIGSEGRMLKMHKELDTMDEDEDGATGEQTLAVWCTPSRGSSDCLTATFDADICLSD